MMGASRKIVVITASILYCLELSSGVILDPPKPYGYATTYDWSFSSADLNKRNQETWFAPSKCSPIQVSLAARHGSRNPATGAIESANNLMTKIRGKIMAPQYSELNKWQNPFDLAEQHLLVNLGRDEMEKMGIRFGNRFRNLFQNQDDSDDFIFYSSDKSWTSESATAFKGGLASAIGSSLPQSVQERNDLLFYFSLCKKYVDTVVKNEEWKEKLNEFKDGETVTNMRERMTSRLAVDSELSLEELNAIYEITVFEEGLLRSSNWSSVWLEREEMAIVEYIQTIREYYEWSYGYSFTTKLACILMKEFISKMDLAISESNEGSSDFPKGVFAFGHTKPIIPFLTLLGFYNDGVAPSASNFATSADRKFHASTIDRFSTNAAIVLYMCDPGPTNETPPAGYEWPLNLSKYMVQAFLQEIPVALSGTEYSMMPYETFKQTFAGNLDECNFEGMCGKSVDSQSNDSAKTAGVHLALGLISIALTFLL